MLILARLSAALMIVLATAGIIASYLVIDSMTFYGVESAYRAMSVMIPVLVITISGIGITGAVFILVKS